MPRKPVKKKVPQKSKQKSYKEAPQQSKAREQAQKEENAKVRQAIHGGTVGGADKGVTIISGRPLPTTQRPEIISKHGRR